MSNSNPYGTFSSNTQPYMQQQPYVQQQPYMQQQPNMQQLPPQYYQQQPNMQQLPPQYYQQQDNTSFLPPTTAATTTSSTPYNNLPPTIRQSDSKNNINHHLPPTIANMQQQQQTPNLNMPPTINQQEVKYQVPPLVPQQDHKLFSPMDQYRPPPPPVTQPVAPLQLQMTRPSCPSFWYSLPNNSSTASVYSLPLTNITGRIEFHVSTSFASITFTFMNTATHDVNGIFLLPSRGTVTSARVMIGANAQRLLETMIVSQDEINKLNVKKAGEEKGQTVIPQMLPSDTYVPDLFRLPITNLKPKELFAITVEVLEPLEYMNGFFHFHLPLSFPPGSFVGGVPMSEIVKLTCSIHAISPNLHYESETHMLQTVYLEPYRAEVNVLPLPHNQTNSVDFQLKYFMPSQRILAGLITQPSTLDTNKGAFLLFVTPPTESLGVFARNIIFVIDRSGSMQGEPFVQAVRALDAALSKLNSYDQFNIIAFDDAQEMFSSELVPVTPQSCADAIRWINTRLPRGLTDIETPVVWSLNKLEQQPTVNHMGVPILPFVVLLTDGCVQNDRILARRITQMTTRTRILTFGIGTNCNWYFLKMLALASRGFNVNVLQQEKIFDEMIHLMNMASVPVLTDVQLVMNVESCELFPFPIPDLFVGAPLSIAGMHSGVFPSSIMLQGKTANGQIFQQQVFANPSQFIPVEKVFLKQRLDMLTAKQWFEDSPQIKQQIVDISVKQSFPTPFTSMVAYETNRSNLNKKQQQQSNSGVGRAALIGALAVGSVIVVGAALYSFGDVAASMANAPAFIGDGLTSLGSAVDCCSGCGCFGDLCGGIGACCGDICGICGGIGSCCGDLCGAIGSCGGDCLSCIGSCGGDCIGILGTVCSEFGSCIGGACELLGPLCDGLSSIDC